MLPPTKFSSNKATERLFDLLEHLSTQAGGLHSCVAIWPQKFPNVVVVFFNLIALLVNL